MTRSAASPSPLRRRLQLVLAGLWLLDGLLKLQPYMFTRDFAPMTLGEAGDGAPLWLVDPLDWAKRIVSDHPVGTMVLFALVEIGIGLAIVLAIVLAALIWVFAEGFGMPFQGMGTDPDTGPLLAAIAVAFWPVNPAPSARAAGSATSAALVAVSTAGAAA
ncbi:hypothetical protein [Actinospica sp.]|jgi:hypothetical protein|uniref:hypothetical protein n=1 Tax=Actinospica sp. TaxID=1872142 RepID=UPI002CE603B6|nr:hypothetical protein [Actinospica sp.]HWG24870.1 hypothetical protein [Actinospica sp.]